MDHCNEWVKVTRKLFPGWSYSRVLIEFERINASVGLMNWMKQNCEPTADVNSFISEIFKMGIEPVAVSIFLLLIMFLTFRIF